MSIFSSILTALGIGKGEQKPTAGAGSRNTPAGAKPAGHITLGTPGKPVDVPDMPMVDVVSKLDGLAKNNPQKLDWKVSIVDLLKLLGIDSSFEARKELATELGCPPDLMGDSASMNIWLHKTVLKKISENGGNVPHSLLD
ncbi:MAG TPA: DUF3597 domain-containing protein [Terriglobales bacterium]|nr:DUF3597 domain-containing protein [Terriglobales bacterium]